MKKKQMPLYYFQCDLIQIKKLKDHTLKYFNPVLKMDEIKTVEKVCVNHLNRGS